MTSNEDAEIRKHVYKPLKRGSPTPLYYPLILDGTARVGRSSRRILAFSPETKVEKVD